MIRKQSEQHNQTVKDYMEQLRAMKIGLEARWITKLAIELLRRGQWEKDGRTAYLRLYGRSSTKAILNTGQQVMAKPLRGRKSQNKLSLEYRWVFATGVDIDTSTNEQIVVIGEEAAIRVRTVLKRPASDRRNVEPVKAIHPNVPSTAES